MGKWTAGDIPDQTGRTILITGANSGLGLRSAEALAAKGARVLLACRNASKAAAALEAVKAKAVGPGARGAHARPPVAGVGPRVRLVGERGARSLDVLMNNAGIMAVPKATTEDGFESQLGTNHLGHFALTGLLLPTLLAAAEPRVVTVSSNAHNFGRMDLDDLFFERRRYSRWRAYGQSKLANLLFTSELQRQAVEHQTALTAVAAHPGYAATNLTSGPAIGAAVLKPVLAVGDRLVGQPDHMGALPQLYAATMPDVMADDYWGPDALPRAAGPPHPRRPHEARGEHRRRRSVCGSAARSSPASPTPGHSRPAATAGRSRRRSRRDPASR